MLSYSTSLVGCIHSCADLAYHWLGAHFFLLDMYTPGLPVVLSDMHCIGNESNLLECNYDESLPGNIRLFEEFLRVKCQVTRESKQK